MYLTDFGLICMRIGCEFAGFIVVIDVSYCISPLVWVGGRAEYVAAQGMDYVILSAWLFIY
jgi:hypothetical protein